MILLARGNSMYPTMEDGHKYEVHPRGDDDYEIGDIVVYRYNGMNICHRIEKIIKSRSGKVFYKLKGDNCSLSDSCAVSKDMIIGKVFI